MHDISNTILSKYIIRKTKKQKEDFRRFLLGELEKQGIEARVEGKGSKNIVIGEPEGADVIFTAHYDTPAVMPFPNFVTPRNMLVFTIYQILVAVLFCVVAFVTAFAVILLTGNVLLAVGAVWIVLFGILYLMYAGPANKNNFNDNTSGTIAVLETLLHMDAQQRARCAFALFDNEEKMMLGSTQFRKLHGRRPGILLVNMDCVSDGDHLLVIPPSLVKSQKGLMERLEQAFAPRDGMQAELVRGGVCMFPSDHMMFQNGVGLGVFKKNRLFGLYLDRLHTGRDVIFKQENIEYLVKSCIQLAELLQISAV